MQKKLVKREIVQNYVAPRPIVVWGMSLNAEGQGIIVPN